MANKQGLYIKLLEKKEWNDILILEVEESQSGFIESAQECVIEAQTNAYHMCWNFYGIYNSGILIGFAMHGRQTYGIIPYSRVWLDRYMIDKNYQGKGYGKQVLLLIMDELYKHYKTKKIYLSLYEENTVAFNLYLNVGFKKTRVVDSNNERVMTISKRQ